MDKIFINQKLTQKFTGEQIVLERETGILTFVIPAALNLKVLQFLYDDTELQFTFLSDLCAVHYPENKGREIVVVYQLYNLKANTRICIKAYIPQSKPDIFTVSKLFAAANWMERETYDFFGVNFIGHPNLKRILNVDEMDYFPMRKEYPLEEGTRMDKDDEMFGRVKLITTK